MKSRLVSVALLAAALAFAAPSGALAQGRGHDGDHGGGRGGDHGGDHGNRGGDRGNRGGGGDHGGGGGDHGGWRGGGGGGDHGGGDRGGWRAGGGGDHGNGGDRGGWRAGGGGEVRTWNRGGSGGERRTWNGGGDRRVVTRGGWGAVGDVQRFRGSTGDRGTVRYRGGYDRGGRTAYSPRTYGGRTRFYSGYSAPRYFGGYRYSGGYRYGGYSYPRFFYYNSFYPRPRFIHSSFSIGFVLGSYPAYGFRYYDPYCDRYFNSLYGYEDHCWDFDHPPVVEVLRYGSPVASAVFDDGRWVVDDCD